MTKHMIVSLRLLVVMIMSCVLITGCSKEEQINETDSFDTYTGHEFCNPAFILPVLVSDDAELYFEGLDIEKDKYTLWFNLVPYIGSDILLNVSNVSVNNRGCDYTFTKEDSSETSIGNYTMHISKKEVQKSNCELPYQLSCNMSFTDDKGKTLAYADVSIRPFGYIIPTTLPVPINQNQEDIYFNSDDYCIEYGGVSIAGWEDGGYGFSFRLYNKSDKDIIFRIIMLTEAGMEGFEYYTAPHSYHPNAGIPIGWTGIDYHENPFEFRVEIIDPDKNETLITMECTQQYK